MVTPPADGVKAAAVPKPTSESGPGSIGDALGPLGDALSTAAKTAASAFSGDVKVIAAVELGWLMEELTQGWSSVTLPTGLALTGEETSQAQAVRLTTLLGTLKLTGVSDEAVGALTAALQRGAAPALASTVRSSLIVALLGADTRFPKAYLLGSGLRAMLPPEVSGEGHMPADPDANQVHTLVGALDALSSDLPSHAARSVANSLDEWAKSDDSMKAELKTAQVKLWRSVIVGEKKGTELLEPADYIDAAKQLERHFVGQALASSWLRVVAAFAIGLFAAGVFGLIFFSGDTGTVAAGGSAVLAALGLTWKGIGGTVGKFVGTLETPLWGAELDAAITRSITLTNPPAPLKGAKRKADPPAPGGGYHDRRTRALVDRGSAPVAPTSSPPPTPTTGSTAGSG